MQARTVLFKVVLGLGLVFQLTEQLEIGLLRGFSALPFNFQLLTQLNFLNLNFFDSTRFLLIFFSQTAEICDLRRKPVLMVSILQSMIPIGINLLILTNFLKCNLPFFSHLFDLRF